MLKAIPNETELLLEISRGGTEAFATLFRACHQALGAFVHTLVGSRELTEDIVQDVFVKIWVDREALPEIGKFSSYLFILTRNYTLNCLRKMASDRRKQQAYMETAGNETNEALSDAEPDYFSLLERAIAQLPPQQQKVFELRKAGLKNGEIANAMGISIESVKKYQHLALRSISEFVRMQAAVSVLLAAFSHSL